jgi:hypothetical protein
MLYIALHAFISFEKIQMFKLFNNLVINKLSKFAFLFSNNYI